MNEQEWEYILLHNLPKSWTGQVTHEMKTADVKEGSKSSEDSEKTGEEQQDGEDSPENVKETEGKQLNGTNRSETSNSDGHTESTEENTSITGQGTETESNGRRDNRGSNSPSEPHKLKAGTTGKNQGGSGGTREGNRTPTKSFLFQRGRRKKSKEDEQV